MTRRTQTMRHVSQLADDSADTAMQELAHKQQALTEGEAQLAELHLFQREYQHGAERGVHSMSELLNRQQFLQRINDAIGFQQRLVEQLREAVVVQRQVWLQARNRAKALGGVAQHLQADDDRADERKEQRDADERSLRQNSKKHWDQA
ncbi:MAG: flagellar export protein FliJ [Gammaproteobacteria bacterium HGW-Gammaproteobacteria-2]|nr:MAG: flagellar export protein FliJ [Gammaproteobacteria bacterium HGW-Gammaproteobacteria-2]